MSTDATEAQGGAERRRAQDLSAQREHPPLDIPGYRPVRHLGMGAYGEVWVAAEENTGRRVAIKFYTHRGGLDWSLLSSEVEKLAFLFADRYVVQLLNVGWNAEPPYYIMEYMEQGSLAARLEKGPLPVAEAVELFRHVAIGLVHAHGKGVLHCDLKPANILLDQDGKPRLADFGQSRLSHDQTPALGTLFYMAPEQASMTEAPNARWDVYALGAVLYCMLTGKPPHWSEESVRVLQATEDLRKRLSLYRRMIRRAPPLSVHRKIRGVDRALAEIISRSLAPAPENRYPNVQAVLGALEARDRRRSRRPVMLLGAIGPVLLVLVVAWFAWRGFGAAVTKTDHALTGRALQTNEFLADNLARLAGLELDRRLQRIGYLADNKDLQDAMVAATEPGSAMARLLDQLNDPALPPADRERLRREFRENDPQRQALQKAFEKRVSFRGPRRNAPADTYSYFLNDARGIQIARKPDAQIIGNNYAWRTYFTGLADDMAPSYRPKPDEHVTGPHISAPYPSQATKEWMVTISAPIYNEKSEAAKDGRRKGEFLGVVAMMMPLGDFIKFDGQTDEHFATLVDWRKSKLQGLVLQHPKLKELLEKNPAIPEERLFDYSIERLRESPQQPGRLVDFLDPVVDKSDSRRVWLAHMAPIAIDVKSPPRDDCLMVIVQEDYRASVGATLGQLKRSLVSYGVLGLAMIVIVMIGLWALAIRMFRGETAGQLGPAPDSPTADSTRTDATPSPTPLATPTEEAKKM